MFHSGFYDICLIQAERHGFIDVKYKEKLVCFGPNNLGQALDEAHLLSL